jgi:hypothetical protein
MLNKNYYGEFMIPKKKRNGSAFSVPSNHSCYDNNCVDSAREEELSLPNIIINVSKEVEDNFLRLVKADNENNRPDK